MKKAVLLICVSIGLNSSAISQVLYGDYQVVIEVEGNGYAHSTQVYFDDESWDPQNPPTYGWDACCDALLVLGNAFQPHVFTEVVAPPLPANNNRLSLNALPHLFEETEVPLGFLPGELAQFTFTFNELSSLPAGVTVELEDMAQSVTQDLLVDNTYTTWAATSDPEDRFILRFNPSSVTSTQQNQAQNLLITANRGHVLVSGVSDVNSIYLFDVEGRLVASSEKESGGKEINELSLTSPSQGLYVCKVVLGDGSVISKKILF